MDRVLSFKASVVSVALLWFVLTLWLQVSRMMSIAQSWACPLHRAVTARTYFTLWSQVIPQPTERRRLGLVKIFRAVDMWS